MNAGWVYRKTEKRRCHRSSIIVSHVLSYIFLVISSFVASLQIHFQVSCKSSEIGVLFT